MPSRPRDKTITQPSVRVATQWTPALIKAAFTSAESGYVRSLAELCDNILSDDRVSTVFETRIGGLLGLDINFESSGDGRRKGKAVKALEAGEDWWAAFPETELQKFLTLGRLQGFSFAQLTPTEHDGRFVPKLENWHAKNTRFDWPTRQWMARIDSGAREEVITPGDGQWIVYTPYGEFRPWASGLWRGLARWWLLKSYAQDDAGRRSEKSGTVVVTSEADYDDDVRKEIANDMYEASRDGVISFPKGFDAHLLESKESIKENQGVIIDMANTAIAIAVLGQNLTTEVSGGSFAAAKVHNKVEIQRIRSDSETASTVLHDQALEWWAEFNFGDRKLAPWPIWATDPPTDQKERADVLKTLSEAIKSFHEVGLEPDLEELQLEFGITLNKVPLPQPPAPTPSAAKPTEQRPANQESEEPEAEARAFSARAAATESIPRGLLEGQGYIDALTERSTAAATKLLAPDIRAIADAVDAATDYDDLRKRLRSLYQDADPEELTELTQRALLLAGLAGRVAVNQDASA